MTMVDLTQPEGLLRYILKLDLKQCGITVCIASGKPDDQEYKFRRVNQSEALANKFRDVIVEALEKVRVKMDEGNIELRDFAADTAKPDQEIEYLNMLLYDSLKKQSDQVEHYLDMDLFNHDERDFIKSMRFYVVRMQPPQGPAINFFRHYSQSLMLSQSSFFAMWFQQTYYDDLDQPTFLFERHIDCFSCEGDMFILQKHNFFQIFNLGELEKVARETLAKLEKKDFIHNFQQFKDDCLKDKIKILKLKNISTQPYLDKLTIDDLHRTIKSYHLPIQVEIMASGKKKMTYDAKKRWDILHLLDDAYADSSMTKNSYYLKGKREIRKK